MKKEKIKKLLNETENLKSSTLDAIPHAVFNLQNRRITYANKGATKVFGWKPEELIGKSTRILYRSDKDYKKIGNNFYSVLKKNQKYKTEFPCRRKDGKNILCRISAAIIGERLKNKEVVAVYTDITALKNKEKIQSALYKISKSRYLAKNLKELCKNIHKEIANLMPAENFYIALYDKDSKMFNFAYWVDEKEKKPAPVKAQNGITEYVFNKGQPFMANPKLIKKLENSNTIKIRGIMPVSWLGVPLKNANETIGVLAISSYTKDVIYTEEDKNILSFVSNQIATAIKQKEMEEKQKTLLKTEREQRLQAETLAKITIALTSKSTLNEVFDEILNQANLIMPSDASRINLIKNDILYTACQKGHEKYGIKEFIANLKMPLDKYKIPGIAIKEKKILIIPDTAKEPDWKFIKETAWIKSYAVVPIILHNSVLGVLTIISETPNKFSKEDAKKLQPLANAAAIAIEKARLLEDAHKEVKQRRKAEEKLIWSYEELQKTLIDMVNASVKIVEARDPYTAIHEKRVAQLTEAIAKEIKFTKYKSDLMRVVSLVHDIGKIIIPSEILTKPSKLTKIEFKIIKMHPQVGYGILKDITFPISVAKIVLQHHERMDGSGYPNGLKGNEIMLEARILAVADVVEAMSSHRPYRPALGIDKALEEIEKNKGILYDSKVVNVCIKLFKEKGFKFKE
ncbi:MAG: GAF domain-containing protein [Caldisericota bacterium]|nr:GAF domain-containing protein [Caldisericota bacterium]